MQAVVDWLLDTLLESYHRNDESPLVDTARDDSHTDTPMANTADSNAGDDEDEDGDVNVRTPLPSGPACGHTNSVFDSDSDDEMRTISPVRTIQHSYEGVKVISAFGMPYWTGRLF